MEKPITGYGWYIKRIDNALARVAMQNMKNRQLTMQQGRVLILLAHAPEQMMALKKLEEHFGAAQSTVAGLVSRMEKKGLVEAVSNPSDRRIKLVRLTESGQELHRRCYEDMISFEENLTAALSVEEKEQLLVLLQKVYDAIR